MSDKETTSLQKISSDDIRKHIYSIRGVQVMLDSDLATIYGYTTKAFNQQVKNNIERFPEDLMFELTLEEAKNCSRSKKLTLNEELKRGSNIKYRPKAFTEQGIYMLMTVLKGELAVSQSLALVRLFKEMRHFISDNALMLQHLRDIDLQLLEHDKSLKKIFKQLESPKEKKALIFSAGQLYDAASFIEDIVSQAKRNITIIDKYVDKHTLDLLAKKAKGVSVLIVADKNCAELSEQEIELFNKQYGKLEVKYYKKCHARYIIIDGKILYHCGASLKDAGKQIFSIDIIDEPDVLKLLKETVSNIK